MRCSLVLSSAVSKIVTGASAKQHALSNIEWDVCGSIDSDRVMLFATRNFVVPLDASAVHSRAVLRSVDAVLAFPAQYNSETDDYRVLLLLSNREADAVVGTLRQIPIVSGKKTPALVHFAYARGTGCTLAAYKSPPPLRLVTGAVRIAEEALTHHALARLQLFNGETSFALGETDIRSEDDKHALRGHLPVLRGGAAERWQALCDLLEPLPLETRVEALTLARMRGTHDIERSDLDCAVKGLPKYGRPSHDGGDTSSIDATAELEASSPPS
jgi:hypothetical protein